jgi:hypothetical protein
MDSTIPRASATAHFECRGLARTSDVVYFEALPTIVAAPALCGAKPGERSGREFDEDGSVERADDLRRRHVTKALAKSSDIDQTG